MVCHLRFRRLTAGLLVRVLPGEPLSHGGRWPPLLLTGPDLAQLVPITYFGASAYTPAALSCGGSFMPCRAPSRPFLAARSQTLGRLVNASVRHAPVSIVSPSLPLAQYSHSGSVGGRPGPGPGSNRQAPGLQTGSRTPGGCAEKRQGRPHDQPPCSLSPCRHGPSPSD